MFKYELKIPAGAKEIKLPVTDKIKILAITVANNAGDIVPLQPLSDTFESNNEITLKNQ
jgi:alpha-mannosidase